MVTSALIGKQLGDYQIRSNLGQGGMAHVFKAYDPKLERYAAVKVIDSMLIKSGDEGSESDDISTTERFKREARAIANLKHPNIVGVYQLGWEEVPEVGLVYYMAQAYIEGRDLRQIIKETNLQGKKLSHAQVLRIVRDVASALDYAHAHGVIHRDIKPANIMVMHDGHAVLTDFGLALRAQENTMGRTFGTVHYIAPEQAVSSAQAVPQSDLYALGIVIYEIMTGRVPFDSTNGPMAIAMSHITDVPPPPRLYNPNIPEAVEEVILRAISKNVEHRYATGKDFVKALEMAIATSDEDDTHDLETGSFDPFAILSQGPMGETSPSKPSASSRSFKEVTQHHFDELEQRKLATAARKAQEEAAALENATPEPYASVPGVTQPRPLTEQPASRNSRTLWYIAGALALVALVAIAALMINNAGGAAQPTATPTTQAVAASVTETSAPSAATAENTLAVAVVSTDAPTETPEAAEPTATLTPSLMPSPTPTGTPAVVAAPSDESLLLLRYDGRSIVLMNRSIDAEININNLVLTGGGQSFEVRSFPNFQTSMPPEFCYQLWTLDFRSLPADEFPAEFCASRRGFAQTGRIFWVSEEPDAVFEVRRSGRVLGTCPAVREIDREDNRCVIDIN